jgi:hypothetical protein
LTLCALALCVSASAATFDPPCKLPFASIANNQPIDSKCGVAGNAGANQGMRLQDMAKNNFCAKGKPVVLRFSDYPSLQKAAEKALGANYKVGRPPQDRSGLKKIAKVRGTTVGEGDVVRIVAFVEKAHYSDVSKGENVNCNLSGEPDNDIHIPLVSKAGDDECNSVTAEISPHFRPNAWTPSNLNQPGVPLRFTGQLMFDAEHKPCAQGKKINPARVSVWEIHPVYAVDVCKSASKCDASVDSDWTPLDQYAAARSSRAP